MTTLMAPIAFQPREAETVGAFVLVPTLGGTPWILPRGRHVIGSGAEATLQLANEGISPQHCLLIVGSASAIVKAWDSRTWINDGPVRESTLRPNDRLTIGPWTYRFRLATADELLQFVPENPSPELPAEHSASHSGAPSRSSLIETASSSAVASFAPTQHEVHTDPSEQDDHSAVPAAEETRFHASHTPEPAIEDRDVLKKELHRTLASVMEQRLHLEQVALDQTRTQAEENARLIEHRAELERLRTQLVRRETEFSLRMQAIEATESAQQTLRKELERTQIKLLQRQVDLADAERAFQQQLEEKTSVLEQREERLKDAEAAHAQSRHDLTIQKQALADFEQQLAQREAGLRDEEATWQVKFASQKAEAESIEKRLADLELRSDELSLLEQSLSRREAEVTSKDSELSQLKAAFGQREEEIHRAENDLELQRSKLSHDLAQLAIQQSELTARDASMTERSQALEVRERALASEKLRIEQMAETTRLALHQEQAQQEQVWSRWDESMKRATTDLRLQMEALEKERAALEAVNTLQAATPELAGTDIPERLSTDEFSMDSLTESLETRSEIHPDVAAASAEKSCFDDSPEEDTNDFQETAPQTSTRNELSEVDYPVIQEALAPFVEEAATENSPEGVSEPVFTRTEESELTSEPSNSEDEARIDSHCHDEADVVSTGTVDWLPVTPGESYVPEVDHSESAASYEEGVHHGPLPTFDVSAINPWADETIDAASRVDETNEASFGEPLASRRLWNDIDDEESASSPSRLRSLTGLGLTGLDTASHDVTGPSADMSESNDSAAQDPALSLRAELAQLFGIHDLGASRSSSDELQHETANDDAASADDSTSAPTTDWNVASFHDSEGSPSLPAAGSFSTDPQEPDENGASGSLSGTAMESADISDSSLNESVHHEANSGDATDAEAEEDSVASYMAKLLGRYGQKTQTLTKTTQRVESPAFVQTTKTPVQEVKPHSPETPATWNEEPRHKVDKDEFRAHLESMRQVANVSARTAVKSSHWKRSRMQVLVKGTLAAGALATGSVLLLGRFSNGQPLLMQGLVVTVVGIYLLLETLKGISRVQTSAQLQLALANSAELESQGSLLTENKE